MRIDRIQDDEHKFVIRGGPGIRHHLEQVFSDVGRVISVTESERGAARILYTENIRDIVLSMIREFMDS